MGRWRNGRPDGRRIRMPSGDPIRLESGEVISDGGTAMMAWARMQFPDVPEAEREAVFNALLCYCELDTLAMVMIHQHWAGLRG
jgi:hypothetical protein